MRVLVTGATGFIGQALLRRLADHGHEPIAVGRQREERPNFVCWNLAEEPAPASLPGRIDAVVHTAQSRHYRAPPGDASELFAVNTTGTFRLLDYAARAEATHFCLLSSGTIYEPFARGFDEGVPLAPTSMLGATKLAAEVIATPFETLFPVSILRLFSPYGPGQTSRLIPDLIRRVRDGVDVQLAPEGQTSRIAPMYVDDVCSIILASLSETWRGPTNVASPHATTIRDTSEIIGRLLGKTPKFEIGSGTALDLVPSIERLRARFDLSTLVPLEEGLARTIAGPR